MTGDHQPWDPDGWVHITSAGPGSGNGSFSFSVDPNTTGTTQTSTLYLSGQYGTVQITQSAQFAPAITSVSPASGPVGTAVTIAGTNFGATQGASTVTFNGLNAGTVASWSATSITVAVPAPAVSGPVVVTVNGVPSNGATFTVVPVITTVSPTSGAAGTQVVISGSGFGPAQGAGLVWLGSTPGTIVNWSSHQITATVASNSTTGTVQVSQGGTWSNSVPFTVATPTISSITPTTGVPGVTVVTISGSGFGASQGSGHVWLGTANGIVQGWSDTQVVAQVAAGSTSGNAAILQNGVWSNPVAFTVDSLLITSVTPASGAAGTSVTVAGSGFGSSQGAGTLILGGVVTPASTWSDTQITASVAGAALTGVVRVQQNGAWSNALPFTVPGGVAARLVPHMINMAVGDTHTIQALNSSNQSITGLAWTSSDPTIVSLSTDDPPVLTAVAIGRATISAGGASADVTVSPTLSPGTTLWSNPGDGSGVYKIVPAVPSSTGVADVFAFQNDGTVAAITSDGTAAWTADVSQAVTNGVVPDFQGGLVAMMQSAGGVYSIVKYDGMTGAPGECPVDRRK